MSEQCPVINIASEILSCQQNILRKIRLFKKRSIKNCNLCNHTGECEQILEVNMQIELAIREVVAEWGI